MMEVLSESVRLVNLPFTILLGCVVGYWLLMCVGLFDFDSGLDANLDADADMDAHVEPGWFAPLLEFLSIGEMPMMVVVSIMAVSMWTISMVMNHYWNDGSLVRAGLFLVPNLVVTCVITHFAARPFQSLFKALNREGEEHEPIIGRTCIVTTSEANAEFGQAEIKTQGAPILINVRSSGDAVLRKGETGLVIQEDREKSIYTVVKVTPEKLES